MKAYNNNFDTFAVLAYHHVLPADASTERRISNSPFVVSEDQFYRQMQYLAQHEYRTIDFNQLSDILTGRLNGTQSDPSKLIAITFDDGWEDNYEVAFPILKSFDFTATFFVITGQVDSTGYMSRRQLTKMHASNMQLGSHTHSHTPLELLSRSEIGWELQHSKDLLEQYLMSSVDSISFPHGSYTRDVLEIAKEAGYRTCGTSNFDFVTPTTKLDELPRLMMRHSHSLSDFAKICETRWPALWRGKIVQKSKNFVKDTVGIERYNRWHKSLYGTED